MVKLGELNIIHCSLFLLGGMVVMLGAGKRWVNFFGFYAGEGMLVKVARLQKILWLSIETIHALQSSSIKRIKERIVCSYWHWKYRVTAAYMYIISDTCKCNQRNSLMIYTFMLCSTNRLINSKFQFEQWLETIDHLLSHTDLSLCNIKL